MTFSFIGYPPQSFWGSPIARDILAVTELIVYKLQEAKERKREIREAEESACYSVLNTGTPRYMSLMMRED